MILIHLNFQENKIPVYLEKSNRKTVAIQVMNFQKIVLKAPYHCDHKYLIELVTKKSEWLNNKFKLYQKRQLACEMLKKTNENQILYRGKFYPIVYKENNVKLIEINEENFYLKTNASLANSSAIKLWLQEQCYNLTQQYLSYWTKIMQVHYQKFRLSDVKSNWGSCNNKGTISINWRIIMAPETVHHYLIIHELCHLVFLNHSKQYWLLVEKFHPNYKSARKWLKDNSYFLRNMI
jgi:hypothetical protein